MNVKRFVVAFLAVYVVGQILNYLIHAVWLADTYAATAEIWRPAAELEANMWIMWVTGAIWSFFFCYIFVRGREGRGLGEGVRYGLIIGLFFAIPQTYDFYAVVPIPYALALRWFLSGLAASVILGTVVAAIYRPDGAA